MPWRNALAYATWPPTVENHPVTSNITTGIVDKQWSLCNVRCDDSVTCHQEVSELAGLFF